MKKVLSYLLVASVQFFTYQTIYAWRPEVERKLVASLRAGYHPIGNVQFVRRKNELSLQSKELLGQTVDWKRTSDGDWIVDKILGKERLEWMGAEKHFTFNAPDIKRALARLSKSTQSQVLCAYHAKDAGFIVAGTRKGDIIFFVKSKYDRWIRDTEMNLQLAFRDFAYDKKERFLAAGLDCGFILIWKILSTRTLKEKELKKSRKLL